MAGKLAQIGSRLVDMAAKKMADDFFANFVRQLAPTPEASPTVSVETPPFIPQAETGSHGRPGWLVWAVIVAVTVAAGFLLWTARP